MKKFLALALVFVFAFAMVACGSDTEEPKDDAAVEETQEATDDTAEAVDSEDEADEPADEVAVMSYDEFVAAAIDDEVTVETYVQAKQGWWTDDQGVSKATFYTQNEEGAYFLYDMPCSEEEYNALTVGTKIRVTGFKAEWSGEVEIVDATFEILEGEFVAEPVDATALLGTDELINYQNQLASFKGMTVESIEYKNDEPGDDIYVTLSLDGASYSFCVEVYLTGTDSDVYTTVGGLTAGDVVDVEGFLYWYEGVNPHITAIALAA